MAKLYVKVKAMTIYAGKKETQMYSDVVLMAVGVIEQGIGPKEAYQAVVEHFWPLRASMQDKPCPRGAFLGLCEEGYVKGARRDLYLRNGKKKSKSYAVDAVKLHISNPNMERLDSDCLRVEMSKLNVYQLECPRKFGSQGEMLVVRTLWANQMINK